jgi:hypothetical protein
MSCLRSCIDSTTRKDAVVCDLALFQEARDDGDDLAARFERRLRDGPHQPDAPAAVHDADPRARQRRAERARNRGKARIVPGGRSAVDADAHGYSTSVPFTAARDVARGRMPFAPSRLKCSVA